MKIHVDNWMGVAAVLIAASGLVLLYCGNEAGIVVVLTGLVGFIFSK